MCLKVYQEEIDPSPPCTFGEAITPTLGENDVDFSKADLGAFANPVRFMLASWQVRNEGRKVESLAFVCFCVCVREAKDGQKENGSCVMLDKRRKEKEVEM